MSLNRLKLEKREHENLSKYATKSSQSAGRKYNEAECEYRTVFQRDKDRILHSKSFRRLKHKTQVFLSPEGDHYRTRLTHTLEVSQIARTIARALALNEDLTEAIALGHDLGHTPFGHCGEFVLNEIHKMGFKHNEQSYRVVAFLEDRNKKYDNKIIRGLNLTEEVGEGILHHSGEVLAKTLEGQIVHIADRIAYINHDIDDAIRAGIISDDDIPKHFLQNIGISHSKRINNLINNVIETSYDNNYVKMSQTMNEHFLKLREFMFQNVYLNPDAKSEEIKAKSIVRFLYEYFCKNPHKMSNIRYDDYKKIGDIAVVDYIAGMTDRYAIRQYKELFIPKFWH